MSTERATDPRRGVPPFGHVLGVAVGGAIGGSLRHALVRAFPTDTGAFPWVVFVENVTGAFALGVLLTVLLHRWRWRWDIRPFAATGVLGSFTTFSNLSLGVVELVEHRAYVLALAYAFGSLLVGVVSAGLGVMTARLLVGGRR